jgi:hypothetical protein
MQPRRKELILAAVVMVAIPAITELILRVSGIQFGAQFYIADQQRGWSLRPGAEGMFIGETKQWVRINSHGFRDVERSYEKTGDTVRVAVLGNSWTEALQVPLEKTYCLLLERRLAERSCFGQKHVEVLNFGVSGYSTAQELLLLRQEIWRYHPDFVIVAFYSARDVANNLRQFNNAANPEQSPYFIYREDRLVVDDSFRMLPAVQTYQITMQRVRDVVSDKFRFLQALNALIHYCRVHIAMAELKERTKGSRGDSLEYSVYAPPAQPALEEAWHVTEGLLLAIRDEVQVHGAQLRIVILANRPQVIPDRAKRLAFINSLGVSDLSYADERIKAIGAREGIPVTPLGPLLSDYAETHHVYLNGFDADGVGAGHWNETGHQAAAAAIGDSMCQSDGRKPAQSLAVVR